MEGFKQPEGIQEEVVIEALDSKGAEDVETKELFEKFTDQCMAEADLEAQSDPENPQTSNRANIKAQK